MIYDERLIGRKPSDEHVEQSRVRLNAMFERRFERWDALHSERRLLDSASFNVLRGLVKEDPTFAAEVKRARTAALAERPLRPPERIKVRARARLGSIAVTLVPPFWPYQWSATTGSTAQGIVSADGNSGAMSFSASTGQNGKTASVAVGMGYYFQPLADNGIMQVFANPSLNYGWESLNVLDSSHTRAYFGLHVEAYTLSDVYVQTVIDQHIILWDSTGGQDRGSNSGYPLSASTPVDSDHYYDIWVLAYGDAEADGWSTGWGSGARSEASLVVPSISVDAY
jgi:hypothetical protein